MAEIIPYKDRTLDPDKKVNVYRCLNRKGHVYSVQQSGKVIGHTTNIILVDVTFNVNPSGKKRAIETKVRNVHAKINGYVREVMPYPLNLDMLGLIKYYPFCEDNFTCNDEEITECNVVTIEEGTLVAYNKVN
jgi:hypothetical protein